MSKQRRPRKPSTNGATASYVPLIMGTAGVMAVAAGAILCHVTGMSSSAMSTAGVVDVPLSGTADLSIDRLTLAEAIGVFADKYAAKQPLIITDVLRSNKHPRLDELFSHDHLVSAYGGRLVSAGLSGRIPQDNGTGHASVPLADFVAARRRTHDQSASSSSSDENEPAYVFDKGPFLNEPAAADEQPLCRSVLAAVPEWLMGGRELQARGSARQPPSPPLHLNHPHRPLPTPPSPLRAPGAALHELLLHDGRPRQRRPVPPAQ